MKFSSRNCYLLYYHYCYINILKKRKKKKREKRFLDKIRVRIRPGKGGEGSLSFGEGRTKRYGPPDGGSGGKGGDIIVVRFSFLLKLF